MAHQEADDATRKIIERLRALRIANDGLPEEALKDRLSGGLKETLAGLPSDKADNAVALVRAALIREAQTRQERIQSLENELAELKRERDGLRAELAKPSEQSAASTPLGKDRGVDRIRRALLKLAEEGTLTGETMSLSAEDLQLLQVVEILYQFALAFTTSTQNFILREGHDMEGSVLNQFDRTVRDTFKRCAEGKPGSLKSLDDLLKQASRFLEEFHQSYQASIRTGVPDILKELDPQAAVDRNRGRLGVNYENALKELLSAHTDIAGEPPSGIWVRFFQKTLRAELKRRTQAGPGRP